jgi:hypothetical protein
MQQVFISAEARKRDGNLGGGTYMEASSSPAASSMADELPRRGDGESRERKGERGTLELREKERKWSSLRDPSLIWRPGSVSGRKEWGRGHTVQGSNGMVNFA